MKFIIHREFSKDMEQFEDDSLNAHCQKLMNCDQTRTLDYTLV